MKKENYSFDIIDDIIQNYESCSPGILKNLRWLLSHGALGGTGKMFFLATDQGFEHGPDASFALNPAAYDPLYHFELAHDSGLTAFAAPYGLLCLGASKFAGKVPLILKLNHSNSLNKKSADQAVVSSVRRALDLGCAGIGFTIYPGSDDFNKMLEELNELSEEASKFGLLTVVWSYARGPELNKDAEVAIDVISYAAHMACLAGAHIVKVKLPSSSIFNPALKNAYSHLDLEKMSERVAHVRKCCLNGKRLVIFSGGASKDKKEDLYDEISAIRDGNGNGSIIGRNIFQREKTEATQMIENIQKIYLAR